MGSICTHLVADLFLYCYESDFMDSLNHDNPADVIETFDLTSRYLDDLLNIDNPLKAWSIKFIHLNYSWIKPTPQIPKPPFWIYIFMLQMNIYNEREDFGF